MNNHDSTAARPFHQSRHVAFRNRLRAFIAAEITPHVDEWEAAGEFPEVLRMKAAAAGVLGAGFSESCGGRGGDIFDKLIVKEELARFGSGGVRLGLTTHGIALPPILAVGSEALRARVVPEVLSGRRIAALAVTEPEGGSDVAALQTTAHRNGDSYLVNGEKIYISSGCSADYLTVAVRTGGPGTAGLSLLLIERGTPGLSAERQNMTGWRSWDNAHLRFADCRVPVSNLIGAENAGFITMMQNFNEERLGNAAILIGAAKACWDAAFGRARNRRVFGRAIIDNQVIRHKLVDMRMRIKAAETLLDATAWRFLNGQSVVAEIAMAKNAAAHAYESAASEAVQIHGAFGLVVGVKVERLFRESKILSIGGGTTEIMKDLAARQMGFDAPGEATAQALAWP